MNIRACTYCRQFRQHNCDRGEAVDDEVCQIIMGVMGGHQEKKNWHHKQKLLSRRVLVAVVDLLPHVQIIISSGVEIKRHTAHVVEHEVRSKHVRDVGQGPGRFL